MQDDLNHIFRNIYQDPVSNDVKIAFSRVLLHCEMNADDKSQMQALKKFESFGKIVLLRNQPVKSFFHQRLAHAAVALGTSFSEEIA